MKSLILLSILLMFPYRASANDTVNKLKGLETKLKAKDPNAVVSALFVSGSNTLVSFHPDTLVKMASVTKVFSAMAALEFLGANHRFKTEVFFRKRGHRVYIQGHWDPSLKDTDLSDLAACIRKKLGKTRLNVYVVSPEYRHLPWCGPKDRNDHVYAAEPASLMANLSAVKVTLGPAQKNTLPVIIQPDAGKYFTLDKRVRLRRRGRRPAVAVHTLREAGHTVIRVRGRWPRRARTVSTLKRVFHPLLFAGWIFHQALIAAGMRVADNLNMATHAQGHLLCTHESVPLSAMLVPIMQHSLNPGAEAIVRAIDESSQVGALTRVTELVNRIKAGTVRFLNGCGLGCGGISTVRTVVRMLQWSTSRPWADTFWHALPRPGKGTLKHRLRGGPKNLRAKTGTLDDCTALAGAFDDTNGRRIFFAIIVNARGMNRIDVVHLINRTVMEVAGTKARHKHGN